MASSIPSSMRALALAKYGKPSTYDVATLPTPKITKPDDVLIKVHATSINPVDVKMAGGMAKMLEKNAFPYKIGYDVAGTVAAVGTSVTLFKPGDEVYSRIPSEYRGAVAEYALSTESATALKPESLDFVSAAAIPLAALTALQSMQHADKALPGGLKGKTVFIPAGMSGTGSFAVQLAKNVFGVGKVITTLSTKKIAQAEKIWGSEGIQYVDYTNEDVVEAIGKGTVDYFFDTMAGTTKYLSIMKKGGVIVSISTVPSGTLMKAHMAPQIPTLMYYIMNLADWYFKWRTGRVGVNYTYVFMTPDRNGLEQLASWAKEGKVLPLVGRTAKFSDIDGVREGCQQVFDGKGGIGKFVIEIV